MNAIFYQKTTLTRITIAMIFLLLLLTGCSQAASPISQSGLYFDTVITVTIYDSNDKTILDSCFELADYYENLFNKNIESSDIWNINHSSSSPVSVHSDTTKLLQYAIFYAEQSNGLLDPTIGSVSKLWDFHNPDNFEIPPAEDIAAALECVDYHNLIIDEENNQVILSDKDAEIDVGFIAKGYIADRIKDYLAEQGITSALINLGGNIQTVGTKTDGSDFLIGIKHPFSSSGTSYASIFISQCSAVTAGTYERSVQKEDTLYHHILDTATGYPINNSLTSVTVIAPNSTDADALSTWCLILGLEDGLELIKSQNDQRIGAVFITKDGKIETFNEELFKK